MPAARSTFLGDNLSVANSVSVRSLASISGDQESPRSPPTPPYREARLPSPAGEDEDRTAYERVLYGLHHDQRWLKEITLGRRVGFYRFRGELGQGNFSTVRLAFHQLTRDKVAVKVIDKSKLDQKTQRMLAREIANMDAVAHPNIIRLFEVVETLSRIHLVLEFAPGGELFNHVTTEGLLQEQQAAQVFAQVLAAITYLHQLSIIHRDIKAENVFLAGSGQVKLGDFGFSTRVRDLEQQLTTFCGSPPYAAPELYKDESYQGPAVDIWALGVLLYFILTADMPFKANTVAGLKRHILAGGYIMPDHITQTPADLIATLLAPEPSDRPSAIELSTHPFMEAANCVPGQLEPLPEHLVAPLFTEEQHEVESEAVSQLATWGISQQSLEEGREQGARSPSLATYRILAHRLAYPAPRQDTPRPASSTPVSPAKDASPKKRIGRLVKNGHAAVSQGQGVKSKTCVIV